MSKLLVLFVALVALAAICESIPVRRMCREPSTKEGCYFYHVQDGFFYHRSSVNGDTVYFKCIRYERGCRARAVYHPNVGFDETRSSPGHDHEPDPFYADEVSLRCAILDRCRSLEYTSFRNIIDDEGRRFAEEVASRVTLPRMRNAMRNARMEAFPPPPATLRGLTRILTDHRYRVMTQTEDGQDNLYGGSVTATDGSHHILYISQRMLEFMTVSSTIHGDGTFKIVPSGANGELLAQQVFVIITTWNHHIIPIGWVLMESRTESAYSAVFQLLRRLMGDNEIIIERVITDFERGQQNAWRDTFGFNVQGCLWHLVRAFVAEARELQLEWWIRNVDEYRRIVRIAGALPLLPHRLMRRGLILLTREAMREGPAFYRRVRPFLRYLNRRWISHPWRSQWMCVYGSRHRTNNAAESHNRLLRFLLGTHPNVYMFLSILVRLERCARRDICALREGRRASASRRASAVNNDNRLRRLQRDLANPPGHLDDAIWNNMRRASNVMCNVFNGAVY